MKQYTLNLCSFLLLVLFPAFLSAQSSFPYFEYHFPDTLPERFHYDPLQTYQSLKAIPYDTTIYTARQHERFSKAYAVAKQSDLFRGHLYVDWHALENYLNTILDSITPPHLLTQSKLHVYPTTDPTENAFSLHDGTIYFNVGLMAEIQNEAALAHVLAHEIAHYLNDDARTRFYKFLALEGTAPWFIADDLKQATQYSKQQELQADKYAHRQITLKRRGQYFTYSGSITENKNIGEAVVQCKVILPILPINNVFSC